MRFLHRFGDGWLQAILAPEWRAGLIALLAAAAVAVLARLLGHRRFGALACGLGLAAAWAWASNLPAWPRSLPERLPEMALIATAPALFAGSRLFQRARAPALVGIALLCGWWLAGTPRDLPHLLRQWPVLAVMAGWCAASVLLLAEAEAWRVTAASVALWAALGAVGAPGMWLALALAPAGAALGAVAAPPAAGAFTPAAAGIGAVIGGAMLGAGLLRGRISAVEFVALAPFGVIWLSARLLPRLRRLGGAANPAAAALALLGVALITFAAAAFAGFR